MQHGITATTTSVPLLRQMIVNHLRDDHQIIGIRLISLNFNQTWHFSDSLADYKFQRNVISLINLESIRRNNWNSWWKAVYLKQLLTFCWNLVKLIHIEYSSLFFLFPTWNLERITFFLKSQKPWSQKSKTHFKTFSNMH